MTLGTSLTLQNPRFLSGKWGLSEQGLRGLDEQCRVSMIITSPFILALLSATKKSHEIDVILPIFQTKKLSSARLRCTLFSGRSDGSGEWQGMLS